MKLVKEHINEKFTEDTDPIHDMGIGISENIIKRWIIENTHYNSGDAWKPTLDRDPVYILSISAEYGRLDFLKYLIDELNYDVNMSSNLVLRAAIHDCPKEKNQKEIVEFLLDRGAILNDCQLNNVKQRNPNMYKFIIKYWKNK